MKLTITAGDVRTIDADVLVVGSFKGRSAPSGAAGALDEALSGELAAVVEAGDFAGKLGEVITLYGRGRVSARRVMVVGLGPREVFGVEEARRAAASAASAARALGVAHLATVAHGGELEGMGAEAAGQATVEGSMLALYGFGEYKGRAEDEEAPRPEVGQLTLVALDGGDLERLDAGARVGEAVSMGANLARDLANHPANVATPTWLAERAAEVAASHGMRIEVWDRQRIVAEGMGAFASVAKGSDEEPRFVVLEHAPANASPAKPVVLVGKGLTFDSGGISLKPGKGMGAMKYDMCGAAAVVGAMDAVGRLALPRRVVGIVAATENLPSGHATRPGDIVKALNGKTIEILNTDAEGRMVLADALAFASRLEPAAVVDFATLTGAMVVALGKHAAGLFANDDVLAHALTEAGERTGERLWRFPLWPVYGKAVESEVADIKNTSEGDGGAGSIFGGKFLEHFVDYPWAHIDIAGVAWSVPDVPYLPKGATGYGVRLCVEYLRRGA